MDAELIRKADNVMKMCAKVIHTLVMPDWRVPDTHTVTRTVLTGLEKLERLYPNMSDSRIVDFVVYQIYRYRDVIPNQGFGWSWFWCFTNNAVAKYKAQFIDDGGKTGINYYIDRWLESGGLSRANLLDIISHRDEESLAFYVDNPADEQIKVKWLNTPYGLVNCIKFTSGWSPKSQSCQQCQYEKDCVFYTQKKYPEIYRLRKESENKN